MPTEQQVAAAVVALVDAALPPSVIVGDPSTIPDVKPAEFVVVTVVRRSGGNARAGQYVTTGWSIYLLAASKSSVANARNSLRLAGAAIEGERLSAGGETSTPMRFDNGRPVAEDADYFSGVSTFNCAI
jgi:hypothetical protein